MYVSCMFYVLIYACIYVCTNSYMYVYTRALQTLRMISAGGSSKLDRLLVE